jgi:carbamoyl-phosphate synthase large subunit
LLKVRSEAELTYALSMPDYVLQECLGTDETEYTVGCFCDKDGELRGTIAMHRELHYGTTCRAELGDFPEVRHEAARIARALKPMGPANVQMRISNGKPVCFEINVRFSGTTSIRARFGWNDVEAALRHFVQNEPARDLADVTYGVALRYWDEMCVDPRGAAQLNASGSLDHPQQYELTDLCAT